MYATVDVFERRLHLFDQKYSNIVNYHNKKILFLNTLKKKCIPATQS